MSSQSSKRRKLQLLRRRAQAQRENALARYRPYDKQREFHNLVKRERMLNAGNQLGKTFCGASEMAVHLTGLYPEWWTGRRFDRPIRAAAGSVTSEVTRDGVQRNLLGPPGSEADFGTGAIPRRLIEAKTRRYGIPNAIATVAVKHVSGGISTLSFKSYDQGREKWQADTLDLVWFDEEPPEDIYFEGISRTNATEGMVYLTFTPLMGMSTVVHRFLAEESEDMGSVRMTIEDAEHISPEQREKIIKSYPAHEREARTKGIPALGSGRVFPVPEEDLKVASTPELEAWLDTLPAVAGIDFGWDHPSAGVEIRHDRDTDTVYVRRCARMREATPLMFAAQVKPWGEWIPWAWPHDGLQHDKGSGEQLAEQYRAQGLNMMDERATFEDGTNGVEAGLMDMLDRMQTGRLKVLGHLEDWFQEFRLYHRKNGVVVKERDDLMAASRYALMMLREAATAPKPRRAHARMRRIG